MAVGENKVAGKGRHDRRESQGGPGRNGSRHPALPSGGGCPRGYCAASWGSGSVVPQEGEPSARGAARRLSEEGRGVGRGGGEENQNGSKNYSEMEQYAADR